MGFPEDMAGPWRSFPACAIVAVMGWEHVIPAKAPHRKNRYIYKTDRNSILPGPGNSPGKSHCSPRHYQPPT
jgi:hypothetical protein